MPLGSPIGSNRGIQTRDQIQIIIEQATVPVVVDAGLGAPSHAAEAMEMGADAVLSTPRSRSRPIRFAWQSIQKSHRSGTRSARDRVGGKTQRSVGHEPLTGFLTNRWNALSSTRWQNKRGFAA